MSNDTAPPALADSVNLDEGRALLEKATPGPWSVEYSEIGDGPDRRLIAFVMGSDETYVVVDEDPAGDDEPSPDARLIVYAVNNLPALLSAVAALETERDEAVKAERERCAVLRVWLLDLSANESDPNEPVADNGATVWDHIRGDARRFAESLT